MTKSIFAFLFVRVAQCLRLHNILFLPDMSRQMNHSTVHLM
uniref:Uncharacterized protein n=1 Tax=Manihot esculenta TaxID=3983 RepID=A0A2C9W3C6_MANES